MVSLEINFKELKEVLGKEITLEELETNLFDMGMELDSKEGNELKIDITPERPDMVSLHGLARAVSAYMGIKIGMPRYKTEMSPVEIHVEPSVNEIRPYTVAAVVTNLSFDDKKIKEMIWVQEKLHATFARNRKKGAIGIYPMEHITPPITFFGEDPKLVKFRPLEYPTEITGLQILSKHPTGKELAHLLEGKPKFPFFKDSKGHILSMPPIINSHETGKVTENTDTVFIECSGFDPKPLNILLNILVTMFSDMGGDICTVKLNYPDKKMVTPNLDPEKRTISLHEINKRIGIKLNIAECEKLLQRMMYDTKALDKDKIEILVPAFRSDIWHDMDIIDDVARAYGFNNLIPTQKPVATFAKVLKTTQVSEEISSLLPNIGYVETFTFALTSNDEQFAKMNIGEKLHIKLGMTAEKSINIVRYWLMPELIKSLMNNRNRQYPQRLYEIEQVVIPDAHLDVRSKNVTKFCAVTSHKDASFTEIKQALDYVFNCIGKKYELVQEKHGSFIEGRAGKIIVEGKEVGIIGEINPVVLENFGLEMPVAGFEIDLEQIL